MTRRTHGDVITRDVEGVRHVLTHTELDHKPRPVKVGDLLIDVDGDELEVHDADNHGCLSGWWASIKGEEQLMPPLIRAALNSGLLPYGQRPGEPAYYLSCFPGVEWVREHENAAR